MKESEQSVDDREKKMVVSKQIITDMLKSGMRIACAVDQNFAIAKHIISKQIQKPVSQMIAFYMPNGDVAVTPCNPKARIDDSD